MSEICLDAAATTLLREAAEWRLIGLLLEHPGRGWREEVRALASQTTDPELADAARRALEDASEGAYLAVLGPGGVISPREVSYAGLLEPGRLLADLAAFYGAFGYTPTVAEPPDHVAVEAGFIAYLRLKEAYARNGDRSNDADTAAGAAAVFMADHLSVMAEPLANRLEDSGNAALTLAGRALLGRVGPPRQTVASIPSDCADCSDVCGESPEDPVGLSGPTS